jgi:hypothetical protein
MQIYHYHPVTNELLGSGTADPDPLEKDNWLIPANATTAQPPTLSENKAAVFNGGSWKVEEDHRGITYWLNHETKWSAYAIGDTPPEGATLEQPEAPEPTLEELTQEVDEARQALYRKQVDPLINEANIKRAMGENDQADLLMQQAIEKRLSIQSENPWPE